MTTINLRGVAGIASDALKRDVSSDCLGYMIWSGMGDLTIYMHTPDVARDLAKALLEIADELDAKLATKITLSAAE